MNQPSKIRLYFSDYFGVTPQQIEAHGAFNMSLVTDLPLFIDPFLLFNSKKQEYQRLHQEIITYLRFLRDKSTSGGVGAGLNASWYRFPEIRQTWLGFSVHGNHGLGLGMSFGGALQANLGDVFRDFGTEQVTKSSHLEKLCLIAEGVGNDKISGFTTNLIHGFLLRYTERFAKKHIAAHLTRMVAAPRVRFNYHTEVWEPGHFTLPFRAGDFVLLTPKDMLTKDDTWINRSDLVRDFESIPDALPSRQLREQINNYFRKLLPKDPTRKDHDRAAIKTIAKFPVLIDAFIKGRRTPVIGRRVSAVTKWRTRARSMCDSSASSRGFCSRPAVSINYAATHTRVRISACFSSKMWSRTRADTSCSM